MKKILGCLLGLLLFITPVWADETAAICDMNIASITGNSVQNGTPTPTNPVEVISVGDKTKNLLDMSDDNIELGKYLDSSGVKQTASNNFYNTNYISVIGGSVYTFSVSSPVAYLNAMEYDSNKTFIKRTLWGTGKSSKISSATMTLDSNTAYVLIGSNITGVGGTTLTLEEILAIDWQFELGSTATSYVPYGYQVPVVATGTNGSQTTTSVYLDEPLRKVGDYADVLDYKNGTITRNVGVKVFDGTETITFDSSRNRFGFSGLDEGGVTNAGYCTHYGQRSTTIESNDMCFSWSSTGTLHWKDSRYNNDINGMKTYFADQYANGTPVTVYYPLATPVVERENWLCNPVISDIKIATTKYVDDEFAPLNTALANAISVVDNVVTQTIAQAGQIATLQNTKQTRPDDDDECPAGKKCLLVTDENGVPHWYEIIESRLPNGYTELEYIGSTFTQYILTDITLTNNHIVECEFQSTADNLATANSNLFGGRNSSTSNTFTFGVYQGSWRIGWKNSTSVYGTADNNKHKIRFDGVAQQVLLDGEFVTALSDATFATPVNMFLFGVNTPTTKYYGDNNIYSCKVWNGSNLVLYVIPAKNSSNMLGMYDMVSGTFFENAGSGSFVAGPVVF